MVTIISICKFYIVLNNTSICKFVNNFETNLDSLRYVYKRSYAIFDRKGCFSHLKKINYDSKLINELMIDSIIKKCVFEEKGTFLGATLPLLNIDEKKFLDLYYRIFNSVQEFRRLIKKIRNILDFFIEFDDINKSPEFDKTKYNSSDFYKELDENSDDVKGSFEDFSLLRYIYGLINDYELLLEKMDEFYPDSVFYPEKVENLNKCEDLNVFFTDLKGESCGNAPRVMTVSLIIDVLLFIAITINPSFI
ncbi:hypothetical protein MHBO_002304 [Bonamia ostreae]|uniref:Uncharacterized protein n=1 Tax=Bonamia ostreae TaxID=126728 RepID=A0ABV2ALW5_9EUKA